MAPRGWRTLNPWGNPSDMAARMATQRQLAAYGKILQVENGSQLYDELKAIHKKADVQCSHSLTIEEKKRYNEICDYFNKNGITDYEIEKAL